jgi:hypothetical protein
MWTATCAVPIPPDPASSLEQPVRRKRVAAVILAKHREANCARRVDMIILAASAVAGGERSGNPRAE